MTTLRVMLDELVTVVPGGIGRYAEELTRQLVATAPDGCEVEGIISSYPEETVQSVRSRVPGLARLTKLSSSHRILAGAWQSGVSLGGCRGMVHAPSLFAPLGRHDRVNDGDQIAVTIHDALAWTHPQTLSAQSVFWQKAMARRASRFADAVVVPTHAVAEQLGEYLDFGDRVRVIGGAPAQGLQLPADADARAARLGLPDRFVFTMGSIDPRKGLRELIEAAARPDFGGLPLVIAGPDRYGEVSASGMAAAAGLPEGRVRPLGHLSDDDLAVAMQRAQVFVYPSLAEGFGLPLVEAFRFGTPVIHSDEPALVEVGGGAGLVVTRADADGYPARLAAQVGRVIGDSELRTRLHVQSGDRGRAFSWRDSAERVWQLHADL